MKTPPDPPKKGGVDFVLALRLDLLQRALAPWPRRAAPLLEVNCGDGCFLPLIWQIGFDIVGTEFDAALRAQAQAAPVPGIDIRAAKDDALPFDDDSFDWVILHLRSYSARAISASASEALRVARRGLMLTFWNSASLAALLWRIFHGDGTWQGVSWWRVWHQLRGLAGGTQKSMATLFAPMRTWNGRSALAPLNKLAIWTPLGAWCVIRVDMDPLRPLTPLPLRLDEPLAPPLPIFEYAQKHLATQHKIDKS